MIIERASSNPMEFKTKLCQIVVENKISSIEKLSTMTGMGEKETRTVLEELVSEGSLHGKFTEDGSRFFLSEVKVSEAPVHTPADLGPEIEVKDTRVSKMILLSGIIMMAVGYILRGLTSFGEIMVNAGGAILMVGLATLIVGWMMFSRLNPPSNVRI